LSYSFQSAAFPHATSLTWFYSLSLHDALPILANGDPAGEDVFPPRRLPEKGTYQRQTPTNKELRAAEPNAVHLAGDLVNDENVAAEGHGTAQRQQLSGAQAEIGAAAQQI